MKINEKIKSRRQELGLKWNDFDNEYKMLKVQRNIKQVNIISTDGAREYKTIKQTPKSKSSIRTVPIPLFP